MATGFPFSTGDVLSAAAMNGLVAFSTTTKTVDYEFASTDTYQMLVIANKATAINITIPTDATYNFPIGTAITVLNINAGAATIKATTSGTTTVNSAGATAAQPSVGQWKSAVAIKKAANDWVVVGGIA
jgi:hypothetical protein